MAERDSARADEVTATASASAPLALPLPEVIDQKRSLSISGLLIQNRPLSEVLAVLSLTSEIPFTADLDALLAAGLDRNAIINFKSTESITIAQLLEKLAADNGLSFEAFEKQWFIVRGDADKTKSRVPSSWPIGDLVSSSEQSAALVQVLSELLPELAEQYFNRVEG